MIFVTVGTTDFDALVRQMDEIAGSIEEEVVAQIGRGTYTPSNMRHFAFAESLDPYLDRARLVVAHGGLGTAVEVLGRGLKLVGVSNPDRYDLHQDDLLAALERRGHLVWCRALERLGDALREADRRAFEPYRVPECEIARVIRRDLGLPDE